MLQAPFPMRLAYVWTDGTPRIVPIGFHWTGSEIVIGGPPKAPKMKALTKNPKVAITIDSNSMPYHVLMMRGTASITVHDGIIPEYVAYCNRYMGEGAAAWLQQVGAMMPQMARIAITPTWVAILDFQERFPSEVERAMERLMGQA
jgi:general stress protein 26